MRRIALYFIAVAAFSLPARAQVSLSLAAPPAGRVVTKDRAGAAQPGPTFNGLNYYGGPVMNQVNGVNVYLIWYGNWSNNAEPAIVTDFVSHIGGTTYFNINSSYYDFNKFLGGVQDPVVNRVTYGGSVTDNYSLGTYLTDNNVANVVGFAIGGPEKLPVDPNGLYIVLTSKDVVQASATSSCGWHSYGILFKGNSGDGTDIKVAWVVDSDQGLLNCRWQNTTPNGNPAADDAVDVIAHELSETVTDPLLNAWVNPGGLFGITENGDLCAWTFGTTKLLPNGSSYNVIFGTRPYLIQEIWVNARGGYCALALNE